MPNLIQHPTPPHPPKYSQRDTEVAREREITLEEVFSHDHLLASHLIDGDFTSVTPDNIKLVAQLEAYLIGDVGVGIEYIT